MTTRDLERARSTRPRLRNGEHGYGVVTKLLHWLTVGALLAQFVVGWSMDLDEGVDAEEDRLDAEADRRARCSPTSSPATGSTTG